MKTEILLLSVIITGLVLSSCSTAGNINDSSGNRDGSSVEKAVIAKSVRAEYLWIDSTYPGSDMLSQLVIQQNDRYYDVVTIRTANGREKDVYFDISLFHKRKKYNIGEETND